jgi:hypothetical protein
VSLGPVVTGSSLAEDEVVWAEELTEGAGADRVHGAWLQVNKHGTGDIASASGLVEIDVDALELKVRVAVEGACGVNAVLIRDNFPELGADLVAALAGLDVDNLTPREGTKGEGNTRVVRIRKRTSRRLGTCPTLPALSFDLRMHAYDL